MKRRTRKDPVTESVRRTVLNRDQRCVLAVLDCEHVCRDRWGEARADDLTLEHVKDELRMGRRAPSDPQHLVVLCYGANVGVPSKADRGLLRAYLASVGEPQR